MPKKGENIYKRKDGRWEGRYIKSHTYTGKIIYGYVYAKTYREAKIKLKEKRLPCSSQVIKKDINLFSELATEWFESVKLHTKVSTQNKYYNMLKNYILPEYGSKTFDTITHEFIEEHCKFLLESGGKNGTGLSAKTVSDTLSIIRNITKFANKKGICISYDANAVQIKQNAKSMRVLNKTEQTQLCEYILEKPEPCNIGILVCLFTGLRIGEICALRWEDISFSDQSIYIHHTLQRIQTHVKDAGAYDQLTLYNGTFMLLYDQRSSMVQVNVDKSTVLALLDRVYNSANTLSVKKEQSQNLQKEIIDNYDEYKEAIERAYTNAEERADINAERETK